MDQRIWMITGISSGLGKALAQKVMKEGDFVLGTFRKREQADEFTRDSGGFGKGFVADLSIPAQVAELVENLLQDHRTPDILVNNAGVGFTGAVEECSTEELRAVMEVNLFAVHALTAAFLPGMRKRKSGHIIQISSHGGIKAFAGFGPYNASKFALEGLSEALAQEVGPLGIAVSLIEPGPFRTNFAGAGLGLARNVIADYAPTAGAFRKKLQGVHGKQEGDPAKAATALWELSLQTKPALRLILGSTALKTIGMKRDALSEALETSREVAQKSVF